VNAAKGTSVAATVVPEYRSLVAFEPIKSKVRHFEVRGTLGEAIELLLDATGRGEFPGVFLGVEIDPSVQDAFSEGDVHVALRFQTSRPYAALQIAAIPRVALDIGTAEDWSALLGAGSGLLLSFSPVELHTSRNERHRGTGDRLEETTIGYPTLRAVGKILRTD
jgi:hypothetical protein